MLCRRMLSISYWGRKKCSFLRDYYQSLKWGIGTGDAFRQLAESHCGCDLSDLFEAWVYEN
jgi:hypothetical protein